MFDAITDPWMFVAAGLLLNLTPGADVAYTVSRAASQGARAGVVAALGIGAGCLFHVALATLGISAAIAASPLAFSVLKLLGAGYLAWLGAGLLLAARRTLAAGRAAEDAAAARTSQPLSRVFRDGVLINATNPKVALFFIAFLPQFVRPGHGDPAWQIFGLGLALVAISMVVEVAIALLASRAAGAIQGHPRLSVWLSRTLGALLVGLGARLALSGSRT